MRVVALCFSAAFVLVGCPARPCPTRAFDDAMRAIEHYQDMRSPARVLRAQARVDRRDSEGRIRGTVLMFIERPDRVRFDAMTQFGPAAVLTSDGAQFALMDLRENKYYEGPTCPANIERMLGIRFSGEEVTRLLLGETPMIEAERRTMSCQDGAYRVTLHAAGGRRQELVLDVRADDIDAPPEEQRLRLTRSEVFAANGSTEWRVTYGEYRFIENPEDDRTPRRGVVMPFTVRFEEPRRGIDTLVRFEDIDLNVEVPGDAFVQQPRPGLTVRHVRCQ